MTDLETWSAEKSADLYGVANWGAGYIGVNKEGHVLVYPQGQGGPEVNLYELVQAAVQRDIELPILFRFNDILRHRVNAIYSAFAAAISEQNYQGRFVPAYPIKVNQQAHIVKVLSQAGNGFVLGLEVGSKPELMAVMGVQELPESLLLCNGYKDDEYIELALLSKKVGKRPIIIIEKSTELQLVLKLSEQLGVDPEIGFRLRVSGRGAGRWEKSGGDRAKFGLTISEILSCVHELEKHKKTHILKLIHFHLGSQITTISNLRVGLKEACQVYVQLYQRCNQLSFLDIGGGLGVDYDGSKTNFESSMNYTVEEYARDIVWTIDEVCTQAGVPHPNIITESGRATTAYHSVLVFNVLGIANSFTNGCDPASVMKNSKQTNVRNMASLLSELTPKNCQETLHDAMELRAEILQQFNLGLISIEDRALADQCYWSLLTQMCDVSKKLHYVPEDLERLPDYLTDTYFCNLSVFQSLPDSWAIEQIFPVTPIHRLNEYPNKHVVLADITCDSDGKIDRFADLRDVKRHLAVHELKKDEPYYIATFLVGAYQETLGDLHNLFGDTNAVHIECAADGRIEFANIVYGDSIREVLNYVQYDKDRLCEKWRNAVEQAVAKGDISLTESAQLFKKYQQAFDGYTYLAPSQIG
ncbi:MAG: biosynthetic arginine decarboxylase [Deltaproteobacteria bacterium]|nr:biosynthetic arginine decarboxylase [Deltaproteobacteria bacterium]